MNRYPLAILLSALVAWPAGTQEADEGGALRAILAAARPSLVGLEIHLRKKTKLERAESEETGRMGDQELDQKAEMQVTVDAWGVVLDAAGTLAMANPGLKVSDIERVVGTAPDGTTFEARVDAVGRRYDSFLLKTDKAIPGAKAPEFAAFEPFPVGGRFFVAQVERVDARWHVNVAPYVMTNAPLVDDPKGAWFCVDRMRQGALLFDGKGRPVGIPFDDYLWKDGAADSFIGAGILADKGLPVAEFRAARDRVARKIEAAAHRVELFLRAGNERGDLAPKLTLFGLPVDDQGTLLVPSSLPAEIVRRVESIKSTAPGGQPVGCAFLGRLKSFSAMLLRPEKPSPAAAAADVKALERSALHFVVSVDEKFGGTWVEAEANRVFRTDKGLKGEYRTEFRHPARIGSFVCDVEGRLLGIYTSDRKEDDLEEAHSQDDLQEYLYRRRGGVWTPDHLRRIRLMEELRPILQKPEGHVDPRAMPVAKSEERRLVWLGIEFQELSKGLAKLWGIEDKNLTNDGLRGLLVTDVYAGSPGEKAGLKVEDILLTVRPPGAEAKPIDLTPERERYHRYMDREGPTPWRARRNYLTLMLTQIGAGKEVDLEVLRGKEKRQVKLTLEDEPVNFESAERHKDNGLGLTVKELTYEVRYFNKLEPGATGVVVAKVENGSRAEVAKVYPLSLITRVNDHPVRDLKDFAAKIKEARSAGARTATLTTLAMGQTRLADVELGGE